MTMVLGFNRHNNKTDLHQSQGVMILNTQITPLLNLKLLFKKTAEKSIPKFEINSRNLDW